MHLRPAPYAALALTLAAASFAPAASAQQTAAAATRNAGAAMSATPVAGTVHVHPGFTPDPSTTRVVGGGAVQHPTCGGYFGVRPQITINATANMPWLRVYVTADVDTSLAILSPTGVWHCASDTYGAAPSIDGAFRRGVHRVWVGTPTPGASANAAVTVTTLRTQRPPEPAFPALPTVTVPGAATAPGAARAPGAANPSNQIDPFAAATALAQQVMGGSQPQGAQPNPLLVPLTSLLGAGLAPNGLPPSLDGLLRQPDAGVSNLSPAQLSQLGDLARNGLTAAQLASAASALSGAPSTGGAPTQLSPAQIAQLGELARGGMAPERLQSTVTSMLQGVSAPQ